MTVLARKRRQVSLKEQVAMEVDALAAKYGGSKAKKRAFLRAQIEKRTYTCQTCGKVFRFFDEHGDLMSWQNKIYACHPCIVKRKKSAPARGIS